MTGPAKAVFDGVLSPDLMPADAAITSPATVEPINPQSSEASFDCASDCVDTCRQPDNCLRDEAQQKVMDFLQNTSLDSMLNLASESLEQRTRARLNVTAADIYLDAAATTPPLPGVIEAIQRVQQTAWGNPSSLHHSGLLAAEALERSRLTIAQHLGATPTDLICTSGATESVHLALLGCLNKQPPGRLVISA